MKRNRFFELALLCFVVCVYSCAPGDEERGSFADSVGAAQKDSVNMKNQLLRDYAKRLAVAVANQDVRQLIYDQVTLRFDGDYDVLIKTIEAVRMEKRNQVFGQVVQAVNSASRISKRIDADDSGSGGGSIEAFDHLTDVIPNAQLAMPVHCKTWEPLSQVPLVAVRPYDYVEKVGARIEAFDARGNVHYLSADQEPSFPVLVVGRSERVNEKGVLDTASRVEVVHSLPSIKLPNIRTRVAAYPEELILTHGFSKSLLLEWVDVAGELGYEIWRMSATQFEKIAQTGANDNNYVDANLTPNTKYWYKIRAVLPDGFSSWSPVMATTASSRSDNEFLKVKRMRFSSSALKAVEQWISGEPEIRLRVVQGSSSGASTVYTSGLLEPSSRSQVVDSWWNKEIAIFAWSTSVYGTVLTFDWREEDWYNKVDFSLTGSYEDKRSGGTVKAGGTVNYENDEGGDVIGNTSVMWWQEKAQLYDLSGFQWQFVY